MKIITILLILLTFVACQSDQKPDTEAINKRILAGDFEMYEELSTCYCDSLTIDSLVTYYKNDSLYTGVCFLTYPKSQKQSEIRQIFKGQLHGNLINLSRNGDTLSQTIYNLGEMISRTTSELVMCHCDSLTEIVQPNGEALMQYKEVPFNGVCNRFFPLPDTNKIYLEMPYKNGVVHGDMVIYNRQGEEILTEVYDEGEKVNG
jgi:antitoxin component YwqK of YwqJK toxin-antitoxin module